MNKRKKTKKKKKRKLYRPLERRRRRKFRTFTDKSIWFPFFVSFARSENHCRRCDRIREEPARCDNPDDVLSFRLCADGPPDLHGGAHAKVYKELSRGRLLGQSHR